MVLLGYLGCRNRAMFCAISENVSHFKNILSRFPSICETIWWEWFCVSDCRRTGGPLPSHSRVFPSIWNSTCKFIQQMHKELWIQSPELCIWHQWGRPITNQQGHPPPCTPYPAVGNWGRASRWSFDTIAHLSLPPGEDVKEPHPKRPI